MGLFNEASAQEKEEVWRRFSKDIGGDYIEGHYEETDRVVFKYKEWEITFDTYIVYASASNSSYSREYTRICIPFIPRDQFRFIIFRKGILGVIAKFFGAQDIVIGDPEFDRAFIIQSNDDHKIQLLFAGYKIKSLIESQKQMHLEITDDEGLWGKKLPEGVWELYFSIDTVVKDVEQLKTLQQLFMETIDQLSKMGCVLPLKAK